MALRGLICAALVLAGQLAAASESERFVSATIVEHLPQKAHQQHRFREEPKVMVKEVQKVRNGQVSQFEYGAVSASSRTPPHVTAAAIGAAAGSVGHPSVATQLNNAAYTREAAEMEAHMATQDHLQSQLDLAQTEHGMKLAVANERSQAEMEAHQAFQERAHAEINAEQALHATQIQARHDVLQAEHDATVAAQNAASAHVDADRRVAETIVHAKVEKLRDEYNNAVAQRDSSEATETADVNRLKAAQRELEESKQRLDQQKERLNQLNELVSTRERELQEKQALKLEKEAALRRSQDNYNQMSAKMHEDTRVFEELQTLADQAKRAFELAHSNYERHVQERKNEFTELREEAEARLRTEVAELESTYTEETNLLKKNLEDEQIALPKRIAEIGDAEQQALTTEKNVFDGKLKQIDDETTRNTQEIEMKQKSIQESYNIKAQEQLTDAQRRDLEVSTQSQISELNDEAGEQRRRGDEFRRAANIEHNREVQKIKDEHDAERSRYRNHVGQLQEYTTQKLQELKADHDSKISTWTTETKNKIETKQQDVDTRDEVEARAVADAKEHMIAAQQTADTARNTMEAQQKIVKDENVRAHLQELLNVVSADVDERSHNLMQMRLEQGETQRAVERNTESVRVLERRFKAIQLEVHRDEQQTAKDAEVAEAKKQAENAGESQEQALEAAEDAQPTAAESEEVPMLSQDAQSSFENAKAEEAVQDAELLKQQAAAEVADAQAKLEYVAENYGADAAAAEAAAAELAAQQAAAAQVAEPSTVIAEPEVSLIENGAQLKNKLRRLTRRS